MRDGEIIRVAVQGPLLSNMFEMQMAAASAGIGIIMTFGEQLTAALEAGILVPVLQDWRQKFSGPFLYYIQAGA